MSREGDKLLGRIALGVGVFVLAFAVVEVTAFLLLRLYVGQAPDSRRARSIYMAEPWADRYWRETIASVDSLYERAYALMRTRARENFFDISDVFRARDDTIYIDVADVGPAGNGLVADRIYAVLRRRGW